MIDELFTKMCIRSADVIEQRVKAGLERWLDTYFRSQIKIIYSESEAAKFLGVSKDTLAAWRKRKLIEYARYPQAKADDLGDLYTYDLTALMNFRARYLVKVEGSVTVYDFGKNVSVFGPTVEAQWEKAA